jgi:1-acyl-sn-glycerol-3-phosphate acyltransferase
MLKMFSYPRAFIVSLITAFLTIAVSAGVVFIRALGGSRSFTDKFIRYSWGRFIIWLAGVKVEVRGREKLRSGKGYLVLFSHTSYIDIFVLYGFFPRAVRFGAKIELFKVPFLGRAMLSMGTIPIDRRYREKVLKLYEAAIPRVQAGEVFALAPEGTRQSEPKIGKLKSGPFLFAIQAQMDIVPVVIAGAFEVLPKNSLWINKGKWRRKIVLQILDPRPTEGLSDADLEALKLEVQNQMSSAMVSLRSELLLPDTTLVKNR